MKYCFFCDNEANHRCESCGKYICDDHKSSGGNCPEHSGGGICFIATAAYGTPFAEEINILRHWRDRSLNANFFGRLFVNFYYKISPPIAVFIKNKKKLRAFARFILNPYVKLLKKIYKI